MAAGWVGGVQVTPFLMDVLHETIVEKTWTPQLVLENMPRPANATERAWLHSVLKRSTDVRAPPQPFRIPAHVRILEASVLVLILKFGHFFNV